VLARIIIGIKPQYTCADEPLAIGEACILHLEVLTHPVRHFCQVPLCQARPLHNLMTSYFAAGVRRS
jgi:hypothetical protein